MDCEARLLIYLLKAATGFAISQDSCPVDSSQCDWNKVKDYAKTHEVHPLVYPGLKNASIHPPPDIQIYFYDIYIASILSCAKAWHEFMRIHAAFREKFIPIIPLKGLAFLDDIYANLSVRLMHDMDILIRPQDFSDAEVVLNGLGYRKDLGRLQEKYWKEKHYHIRFIRWHDEKPSFYLELHWLLDFPVRWDLRGASLWDRARTLQSNSQPITVLSPEDSMICLALHQRRFGNSLAMKNVLDTALLLQKYPTLDWDYIGREARRIKGRTAMYFLLLQVEMLFGQDISMEARKQLGISFVRRFGMSYTIRRWTFASVSFSRIKKTYVKLHFLLQDSLREAVLYFFRIPQEHFAQYYGLPAYDPKTEHYYRYRAWYMLFWLIRDAFCRLTGIFGVRGRQGVS